MGGRYIKADPIFNPKRVKKSKKNKKAQELCDIINKAVRGFSNPKVRDKVAKATVIQIKLMGGVKPECAPYEVSDDELLELEKTAFEVS